MSEIELLTWNIQWARGVDGRVDLDRIVQTVMHPRPPDVICLQEVAEGFADLPGHDGSDQFAAFAARLPDYTCIDAPGTELHRGAARQRFGNLLASRLPVLQVWRHLLPWSPVDGQPSMQRVALEASLQVPFGVLRVTTTHLEYYSHAQRMAQVQRLRELHLEAVHHAHGHRRQEEGGFAVVPRGAAGVLCGDFNFTPHCAEMQALRAPFNDGTPSYVEAWPLVHGDGLRPATLGVHEPDRWPHGPQCWDHFLVTEGLAPRVRAVGVDETTQASDHQPVRLSLLVS